MINFIKINIFDVIVKSIYYAKITILDKIKYSYGLTPIAYKIGM